MKELYEQYGRLMVQAEIINNQVQECKRKIAEQLNKQQQVTTPTEIKDEPEGK